MSRPVSGFRGDIQGLRAVAVLAVVLYHLWPDAVRGGFVGVDVFFVISGFLIIGTLHREINETGRVNVLRFYSRRMRRLLPAATVVLLVTVVAAMTILPGAQRPEVLRDVFMAALNSENWSLAWWSTGYGQATAAATPVQHFWSLSVEEQFYIGMPILLALAVAVRRRRATTVPFVVGFLTISSFVFSVWYCAIDREVGYFITPTRVWELGIGGLLAMSGSVHRLSCHVKVLSGWLGLGAILYACLFFTTSMQFPGWIAVVPVLGSAMVLLSGSDGAVRRVLERPVLVWIGDISYSVYLWHWPIIVFVLAYSGRAELGWRSGMLCGVLGVLAGWASTRLVEDPTRRSSMKGIESRSRRRRHDVRGIRLGAVLVSLTLVVSVPLAAHSYVRRSESLSAMSLDEDHVGAMAFRPGQNLSVRQGVEPVPKIAVASKDGAILLANRCGSVDMDSFAVASTDCLWGNLQAGTTIALVGDSHAQHWGGALLTAIKARPSVRMKTVLRNGCPFTLRPPYVGGESSGACVSHNQKLIDQLISYRPALVVTSAMSLDSYNRDLKWTWPDRATAVQGYVDALRPLREAGIRVAVIRDVPRPVDRVLACLGNHPGDPSACAQPMDKAFVDASDPLADAARAVGAEVLDLTEWMCRDGACPAIIGNVTVYRDNHITDTFSKSLAEPIGELIDRRHARST